MLHKESWPDDDRIHIWQVSKPSMENLHIVDQGDKVERISVYNLIFLCCMIFYKEWSYELIHKFLYGIAIRIYAHISKFKDT